MSVLAEQRRSLKLTRKLLHELIISQETHPDIADKAYRAARHFPTLLESGEPMWSPN